MKKNLIIFLMLIPFLVFCSKGNGSDDNGQTDNQEQTDNTGDNQTPEEDDLAPQVKDGDIILATNANMEKFLTEVTYPENDYSITHILDAEYAPTAPGNSDRPQEYTIRWTSDKSAGAPVGRLWEDDGWSRDYTGLSADDDYFTITNLRPGANYHFCSSTNR